MLFPEVWRLKKEMRFVWEHLNFPDLPIKQFLNKHLNVQKEALLLKTNQMLGSEPPCPPCKAVTLWKMLKELNSDLFDNFWAMASPEAPKFDYTQVDFVK